MTASDGRVDPEGIAGRQLALTAHQTAMRGCRRCVEGGFIDSALPIFRGHAGQRIMVIGQAPGVPRDEHPEPYRGASGRTLAGWFERAGFPPGSLHDYCYLTSITKCFPGPSRSGKGDRAPSPAEIALCRPNLDGELELIRPRVILTLGLLAGQRFSPPPRRPLDQLVGWTFDWQEATVFPLPHPSGVSRWLNDVDHQALLERALAALGRLRRQYDLTPIDP